MIPQSSKVLELGCATGFHSRYLTEQKGCQVIGIDIDPQAVKKASKWLTRAFTGDLNKQKTWSELKKHGPYQVIVASNVVEHLFDPWLTLEHCHGLLSPKGKLVISIPNIAFWRARLKLLRGIWQYEEYGIFDKTHTKFFTLFSMRTALEQAGFEVLQEGYDPAGGAKWLTPLLKMFPNAYAHQIAFLAQRKTSLRK